MGEGQLKTQIGIPSQQTVGYKTIPTLNLIPSPKPRIYASSLSFVKETSIRISSSKFINLTFMIKRRS